MVCRDCGSTARSRGSIANFIYAKCPGSVSSRLGVQATPRVIQGPVVVDRRGVGISGSARDSVATPTGHRLQVTGTITWCTICGLHAEKRIKGLNAACTGKPDKRTSTGRGRLLHLDRLGRGVHPISSVRLGRDHGTTRQAQGASSRQD